MITHIHSNLNDVISIIERFPVEKKVKEDAINVYHLLAEAESFAHKQPAEMVHFHEVGTIDAIIDIVSVCYLINRLGIDKIETTPVATGKGKVRCAHGLLDVPAPATAFLLQGLPYYSGDINSELLTPTGAALLKYFSTKTVEKIDKGETKVGIGFGKKEFKRPNVIKAYLYEDQKTDSIILLQANIDDMTGEEMGYVFDKLLEFGVRDVYVESILMKKNRPGFLLNVLVTPEKKDQIIKKIFELTTTIGIREIPVKRNILERKSEKIKTPFGDINYKISQGYNTKKMKPEYEDLKVIADTLNIPLYKVSKLVSELIKN